MRQIRPQTMIALSLLFLVAFLIADAAETPRHGGILTFMVATEPPSFDGHREPTFAVIHPLAPFYSTLIRVNPENPASPTDFVGDLALDVPAPTDGGTTGIPLSRDTLYPQSLTARA
jgi:peptide/nickel transport system substrate-binding protein